MARNNIENGHMEEPDGPEIFLNRLIREASERMALNSSDAPLVDESLLLVENIESSDGFERMANIVRNKALTEAYSNHHVEIVDMINTYVIIPDDKLANSEKNEINLSNFVRKYLPESDWAEYINSDY